jgi:hypothetical protein
MPTMLEWAVVPYRRTWLGVRSPRTAVPPSVPARSSRARGYVSELAPRSETSAVDQEAGRHHAASLRGDRVFGGMRAIIRYPQADLVRYRRNSRPPRRSQEERLRNHPNLNP